MAVPVLLCTSPTSLISFHPSRSPLHPLQSPTLTLPPSPLLTHLETAATHITSSRLVAFPTETVYGLGASTLSPSAIKSVYELKGRPSDNPLIVHVSSLEMLLSLTPEVYELSELYQALTRAFWPGPLTILFPSKNPPPLPAPQTTAIRIPSHPLARALIHISNTPISAPSANSSGRPSPTLASHVSSDLGMKPKPNPLGCILDGGPCIVGVESTVVNGLEWSVGNGGGVLKVLRPGGVGVEDLKRVCDEVDGRMGTRTRVWVHGRDVEERAPSASADEGGASTSREEIAKEQSDKSTLDVNRPRTDNQILNPATPGMKYKHYSPSVPVYLVYPSNTFPTTCTLPASLTKNLGSASASDSHSNSEISPSSPSDILRHISSQQSSGKSFTLGLMHYTNSPLCKTFSHVDPTSIMENLRSVEFLDMGSSAEDAARALFSGMLSLENRLPVDRSSGDEVDLENHNERKDGVDAILIEACSTEGLGLAVMERAGKAAGGGGSKGGLGKNGSGEGVAEGRKRFWMRV